MRTPPDRIARCRRGFGARKLSWSMRLPIALLASAALLSPAPAHAAVTPPSPTGPPAVGLERLTLTAHHPPPPLPRRRRPPGPRPWVLSGSRSPTTTAPSGWPRAAARG